MAAAAVTCLGTSWVLAWAATWWGVDAYRLAHDLPGASAAMGWAMWTAPYVGATLLAYPLAPKLFNRK